MVRAGLLEPVVAFLGGVGFLLVLAAILRRGRFAGSALFVIGSEYVVVEATGRAPAASVIVYAVGLILVAELLLWAAELPSAALADVAIVVDRLLMLAAISLGAALLALVALVAGRLQLPGAFEPALLGTIAAVALLALPLLLLRRPTRSRSSA